MKKYITLFLNVIFLNTCGFGYPRYYRDIEEGTYSLVEPINLYEDIIFESVNIIIAEKSDNSGDNIIYCGKNKKYFSIDLDCKVNKEMDKMIFVSGTETYAIPDTYDGYLKFIIDDEKYNMHVIFDFLAVDKGIWIRVLSLSLNDSEENLLKKDEDREKGFGEYIKV